MDQVRLKQRAFHKVELGERFQYDGDLFVKTSEQLAYEIKCGRRYKIWTFPADQQVMVILL